MTGVGSYVDGVYGVCGTCGPYPIGGGAYIVPYPIGTLKNDPPPDPLPIPPPPPGPPGPPTTLALTQVVWTCDILVVSPLPFFAFVAFLVFFGGMMVRYKNAIDFL